MKNKLDNNIEKAVLGVDVGGSHITAAIVDTLERSVLKHSLVRKKIDPHASAEEIIGVWTATLKAAEQAFGYKCTHLAVSMPGPFDYENGISFIKGMHKYDALYGQDIKQLFAGRMELPAKAIHFLNDAEAFLRGEIFGSSEDTSARVLGLTLGTGLGSALFEHGKVKDLNLGSAPFLEGIAEDYISTRGILAHYQWLGGNEIQDVKTLVQRMDNDAKAAKAIGQLAQWLADFLLQQLPHLKPDQVIIGGNISKAHALFLPQVRHILSKHHISIPLKVARMGEQAAILGAGSLIDQLKKSN